MNTQVIAIDQPNALAAALALLQANAIIAAPTDTVYGLMGRYDSAAAIERIYAAKQRPPQKAIPVLISDLEQLAQLTPTPLAPTAQLLMTHFWPGPLTLVLPALPTLPQMLTAGQATVAVRMPDYAALRQLMRLAGPLAVTSANVSGGPETHSAAEVLAQLNERIPLLLAADNSHARQHATASTIVDVTHTHGGAPRILRAGPVAQAVRAVLAQAFGQPC